MSHSYKCYKGIYSKNMKDKNNLKIKLFNYKVKLKELDSELRF